MVFHPNPTQAPPDPVTSAQSFSLSVTLSHAQRSPELRPAAVCQLARAGVRVECKPSRRSLRHRPIAQRAPVAHTHHVPIEVGHLAVSSPPFALLNHPATGRTGRHLRRIRSGQHQSPVYHCFSHRRNTCVKGVNNPASACSVGPLGSIVPRASIARTRALPCAMMRSVSSGSVTAGDHAELDLSDLPDSLDIRWVITTPKS
jgi:hypothetical protein